MRIPLFAILAAALYMLSSDAATAQGADRPVNSVKTLSELEDLWSVGAKPTEAALEGIWTLMGVSYSPNCAYGVSDHFKPDSKTGLRISKSPRTGGLVVFSYGYRLDQMPTKVSIEDPQFKFYGVEKDPGSSKLELSLNVYYEHFCRLLGADLTMICLSGVNGDPYYFHEMEKRCQKDGLGIASVYFKASSKP